MFDGHFDSIPIGRVDAGQRGAEVIVDCLEDLPAIFIVDQTDGDPDASKPSGTADTMQVGLLVRLAVSGNGKILGVLSALE